MMEMWMRIICELMLCFCMLVAGCIALGEDISLFSYAEHAAMYAEEEPGVNPYPFRNKEPSLVVDYDSALQRATQECTIVYDRVQVYHDPETDMWMVLFYEEAKDGWLALGGGQSVYMDDGGITHMIVYGE